MSSAVILDVYITVSSGFLYDMDCLRKVLSELSLLCMREKRQKKGTEIGTSLVSLVSSCDFVFLSLYFCVEVAGILTQPRFTRVCVCVCVWG